MSDANAELKRKILDLEAGIKALQLNDKLHHRIEDKQYIQWEVLLDAVKVRFRHNDLRAAEMLTKLEGAITPVFKEKISPDNQMALFIEILQNDLAKKTQQIIKEADALARSDFITEANIIISNLNSDMKKLSPDEPQQQKYQLLSDARYGLATIFEINLPPSLH